MDTRIVPAEPNRVPELASFPVPAGDPYEQARRMFELGYPVRRGRVRVGGAARARGRDVGGSGRLRPLPADRERDPRRGRDAHRRRRPRYRAFWEWVEAALPDERQWFLDHLAVDERERERGIGSALVRFGLDRAARDGVIATLETARPENVPSYEHLGFPTYLETDAPGGGPHVWSMRPNPA